MKKAEKILLIAAGLLCIVLATAIHFTIGWRPFLGPRKRSLTDRHFESTPERIARGRYLVQGVLACPACHSPKNWSEHGAPDLPGQEFSGQVMTEPGLPGTIVASNITPDVESGAGRWTDDQLARAIREGIGHDDRTIFPIMPYDGYRSLSDDDVAAVVVYLRSLPPVQHSLPPTHVNFPVNYLVQGAPQPVSATVTGPNPSDVAGRGKYLVALGCDCHRAVEKLGYGGGLNLKGPWGDVTSANITPDPSGISYYTEATFVTALRTGYVGSRKLNSIMPFGQFKSMTDEDLKAMFAYLKTVKAVHHRVDNSLPPTYCKLCKQKHGAGDQN